jgi:hypothetical protein
VRRAVTFVAVLLVTGVLLPASARAAGSTVTKTVTAVRTHLVDGQDVVADKETVTATVSQTTDLRGRQLVDVNWSGAIETGGSSIDPHSYNGRLSEHPVVILQCRGIDSDAVTPDKRLDPAKCWTQTPYERYDAEFNSAFPAWRLDRYAPTDERKSSVGVPAGACDQGAAAQRLVPFSAADGTVYYPGVQCGTLPPEGISVTDPSAPPPNETYGATAADGTGHAKVEIWTSQQNASLGCSPTVPCALVVIPIVGVSCDAAATGLPEEDRPKDDPDTPDVDEFLEAQSNCEKKGQYAPGTQQPGQPETGKTDLAVSGALWWSQSNWRNRITVPLSFAPFGNFCDILDSRAPVDLYGSELMTQVTTQWAPAFCQNSSLFKFRHVTMGEPLAKTNLSSGQVNAALISRPPDGGYAKPTVNAPVAVSGFGISYAVDNEDEKEIANLRLTPRLLAKLLSESYLALPSLKADLNPPIDPVTHKPKHPVPAAYQAMKNNPLNIAQDPEFQALNPTVGTKLTSTVGGATLLALSANSDVIYALTQYLNADPEARAFLDGKPDPWGMVVNPGYKNIPLPAWSWPLLDGYLPSSDIINSDAFKYCLWNTQHVPVAIPMLPLVAAPLASLSAIVSKMQYSIVNAATRCEPIYADDAHTIVIGGALKAEGLQSPGSRFMLALTALADGPRYGLRNAALQSGPSLPNLAARSFTEPTDASMRSAMALTTPDETTHTWPIPYDKLRTAPGAAAYPGTMVVYAAVPTKDVDYVTARRLGKFLDYAATTGQQPGLGQGQLPPGYLPMTVANGLGALVLYTRRLADVVAAQTGTVPAIAETAGTPPSPWSSPTPTPSVSATPNPGATPSMAPAPSISAWNPAVQLPVGYTGALTSGSGGWALPIAAAVGIMAILVAVVVRSRAGAYAVGRLQARLQARLNRINSGSAR